MRSEYLVPTEPSFTQIKILGLQFLLLSVALSTYIVTAVALPATWGYYVIFHALPPVVRYKTGDGTLRPPEVGVNFASTQRLAHYPISDRYQ